MAKSQPFTAMSRQTLADRVYEQLRESIIRGKIPDGTELNQVELAESFGVSRVPVREALRRLQSEHLIVANPYQRYVVLTTSPEDVLEMLELREELEVFSLKKAMKLMQAGKLETKAAEAILARQSLKLRGDQWLATDYEFHRQFHPSPVVSSLIDDLRERVHRYFEFEVVISDNDHRTRMISEHGALLDAISKGDEEEAVRVLRSHVHNTRELLASYLARNSSAHGGDHPPGVAPDK